MVRQEDFFPVAGAALFPLDSPEKTTHKYNISIFQTHLTSLTRQRKMVRYQGEMEPNGFDNVWDYLLNDSELDTRFPALFGEADRSRMLRSVYSDFSDDILSTDEEEDDQTYIMHKALPARASLFPSKQEPKSNPKRHSFFPTKTKQKVHREYFAPPCEPQDNSLRRIEDDGRKMCWPFHKFEEKGRLLLCQSQGSDTRQTEYRKTSQTRAHPSTGRDIESFSPSFGCPEQRQEGDETLTPLRPSTISSTRREGTTRGCESTCVKPLYLRTRTRSPPPPRANTMRDKAILSQTLGFDYKRPRSSRRPRTHTLSFYRP